MKMLALTLLLPFSAMAADLNCSIKAPRLARSAEINAMAKVSEKDAKKTALDAVKTSGATIVKGGLEVEDGCLVYSYDIRLPGKSGVEEVIVDAGNGKVLSTEHETPTKEAAEKAADKTKK